jgi:hypothetical protein
LDQDAPLLRPVPGERKFLDWPMRLPYSGVDPIALLFATVLARRLDEANQALIELRRQVQAGQPRSVIEKTKM